MKITIDVEDHDGRAIEEMALFVMYSTTEGKKPTAQFKKRARKAAELWRNRLSVLREIRTGKIKLDDDK